MNQTQLDAINWIEQMITVHTIKEIRERMVYNTTKSLYFNKSNLWIDTVWQQINKLEAEV